MYKEDKEKKIQLKKKQQQKKTNNFLTFSAGRFLWKLSPVEASPRNLSGSARRINGARWSSVRPCEPKKNQ